MVAEQVDVVVVGMGPGGDTAAGQLADAGLSVVGIEARLVGGECPYYGCIPSKMMIRAGNALAEARRVPELAGDSKVEPDYAPVAKRIRQEATDNWDDKVAVDRFTGKGGRFVRGRARFTGPHTVSVNGTEFTAPAILLNTGTEPAVPPIDGLADTPFWTNREALRAERPPASLAVLGGGAIGCELAQVFARFGSRVSVLEAGPRLLGLEEPESGELIGSVFGNEGIEVHTGVRVRGVRHDGDGFTLDLGDSQVRADQLLVATGRRTTLAELGVQALGLDPQARFVDPDEHLRVAEGVWAIGDMTGKGAFTHMSMYQSAIAVRAILGQDGPPASYHAVPRVTFTDPEVGAVGLTEAQARDQGIRVRVSSAPLSESARGWIHKIGNEGFVKLVADADRGVLVGATSAGPTGGEVLSALSVAVHGRLPIDSLQQLIFAYPTFHRVLEPALAGLS